MYTSYEYDIYRYILYLHLQLQYHTISISLLPELPALSGFQKTVSLQVPGPGLKVRRALSSVVTILHVSDTHSLHRSTGDAGSWVGPGRGWIPSILGQGAGFGNGKISLVEWLVVYSVMWGR